MAITCSFRNGQSVSASDLNSAIAKTVSGGVEFYNNTPYNISALNGMHYSNGSSGVVADTDTRLKPSYDNGTLTIASGSGFFENGMVITLSAIETVSITSSQVVWVSLYVNILSNSYGVITTTTEPTDIADTTYYLKIAKMTNGVLTDLRKYARGKQSYYYASDSDLPIYYTVALSSADGQVFELTDNGSHKYLFVKSTTSSRVVVSMIDCATLQVYNGITADPNGRLYLATDVYATITKVGSTYRFTTHNWKSKSGTIEIWGVYDYQ